MIEEFINNGILSINKENWYDLNTKYTHEEIKEEIAENIINGKINFPYTEISKYECEKDFMKLLATKVEFNIAKQIDVKYDLRHYISNLYLKCNNVGNKASNYFHQKNRMNCAHNRHPSPHEIWKSKDILLKGLNAIYTLKDDVCDMDTLQSMLRMRFYVAAQFKPIIAKSIYELFGAKRIIDTSSGWGDRLCGFFASDKTEEYLGVDPNTSLQKGYNEQINFYNSLIKNKKKAQVICDGAENIDYTKYGTFDLCFTSPPYFNTEHYSNDEKECWLKYKSDNDWLNNFLFVWMKNVNNALKDNGYIIVNISDIVNNNKRTYICDPMIDFAINELNMSYIGAFTMQMTARANVIKNIGKDTIYGEPVFVFKKGKPSIDKFSIDYQIMNNVVNKESIFDIL